MKITIDRFEEGFAVCLSDGGEHIDIPVSFLPEGAAEGKTYDMSFTELADEEAERKKRIEAKARRLWAD